MPNNQQKSSELAKKIAALPPEKRRLLEQKLQQKKAKSVKGTIPPRANFNDLPLSYAQQRLWILDRLDTDSSTYNIPIAWNFTGDLSPQILQQTLSTIVDRHESLRTTFIEKEGKAFQVINTTEDLEAQSDTILNVIDQQNITEKTSKEEIDRLIKSEISKPFDLTKKCFRFVLIKINATKNILLLVFHHIIADGWSRGILLKEFTLLYKSFLTGKQINLAPLPIQYGDFAVGQ